MSIRSEKELATIGGRMALDPRSEIRNRTGIMDMQRTSIEHFLQGATYTWVKNKD